MKKLSFKYLSFEIRKNLKREVPRWLVLAIDMYITVNTFLLTFILLKYLDIGPQTKLFMVFQYQLPIVIVCAFLAFLATSSYKGVIRHTGSRDFIIVLNANLFYLLLISLVYWLLLNFTEHEYFIFGKNVIIVHFLFNILAMVFLRILYKGIYDNYVIGTNREKNVMIFGAGKSGVLTYNLLTDDKSTKIRVAGFVDDNPKKYRKKINGVRIYSFQQVTDDFINKNKISEIIISIQKISSTRINAIYDRFADSGVELKIVPEVSKWLKGDLTIRQIKPLNIDDFLGREPIQLDNQEIKNAVAGKKILVTGAAGSIGSEISNQLMGYSTTKLIMVDQAETALFQLQQNTKDKCKDNCAFLIADVRDAERMEVIFNKYKPDIVFHAAAYKHVPMMEDNPMEAVITNVKGTKVIADLSAHHQVEKFVMVSTDKAVNPSSVMGATKRIAELYVTRLNSISRTKYIVTRFGNVLGSNGSVIPIFKKQIEKGGPLTVTHPDISRYFMTIPEACQLVLEAASFGKGGEVFVFDMGKPMKIFDLAKRIIRLSGLRYPEDIDIEITGLRKGEKLFEELLIPGEMAVKTHHPKIMIAKVEQHNPDLVQKIEELLMCSRLNADSQQLKSELRLKIKEIVAEYKPLD